MTYPLTSDVSSGQPTYASHYNNLRADAIRFGQLPADTLNVGDYFATHAANLTIVWNSAGRVRITYDANRPPSIVIGGCLLQRTATVYSPAGACTGWAAGTYYVVANRSAGSTSFTLTIETVALNSTTQRTIGTVYWDGSEIVQIYSYFGTNLGMPDPNYDSGWFAVTTGTVYTKNHALGVVPRYVQVLHSTSSSGASEQVANFNVKLTGVNQYLAGFGVTNTNVLVETSTDAAMGTCYSPRRSSGAGYYRILAWL